MFFGKVFVLLHLQKSVKTWKIKQVIYLKIGLGQYTEDAILLGTWT
jgi:hypothetical protein